MAEDISVFDVFRRVYYWCSGHKFAFAFIVFLFAISLGFLIRTANFYSLRDDVLELDPWVFLRYARDVVETGRVRDVDCMRAFPNCFGLKEVGLEVFTSYVVAGVYFVGKLFFPGMTVELAAQIYPPIFMLFISLFFFIFVRLVVGSWKVAGVSVLLLNVVPGFVFRTIAGFSDKEAFAMSMLFCSFVLFFVARKCSRSGKVFLSMLLFVLSGLCGGVLAFTWGGYQFLVYPIVFYFLFRVLFDSKVGVDFVRLVFELSFFMGSLSVSLFVLKSGSFNPFVETYFLFFLVGLFASIFKMSLAGFERKMPINLFSFVLAGGVLFVLALLVFGPSFVVDKFRVLSDLVSNPMSSDVVATSVQENQPSFFKPDWVNALGVFSYLSVLGGLVLFYHALCEGENNLFSGRLVWFALLFFCIFVSVIVLSRWENGNPVANVVGPFFRVLFVVALIVCVLFYVYAWKNGLLSNFEVRSEWVILLFLFVLSLVGARGAVRLVFVAVPTLCICVGLLLDFLDRLIERYCPWPVLSGLINLVPYFVLGFFVLSYAWVSFVSAGGYVPTTFGEWGKGWDWILNNTPVNSSFIAWWDYGYWIQGIANRSTVADGGHAQSAYGDYLIARNVMGAENVSTLYNQLRDFGFPDYFYVVSDDVGKFYQMGRIGRFDKYFAVVGKVGEDVNVYTPTSELYPTVWVFGGFWIGEEYVASVGNRQVVFPKDKSFVQEVFLPLNLSSGIMGEAYGNMGSEIIGSYVTLPFEGLCFVGAGCVKSNESSVIPYYLLVLDGGQGLIAIPHSVVNMFFTELYVLGLDWAGVDLVYESETPLWDLRVLGNNAFVNVKIYKFDYDIMASVLP